jgi:sugar O-acyltransferase (sialic acid O-acetyltransferase NeuD family)
MKKLFIFGLGTLAELAQYYILHDMNLPLSGFVVDDLYFTNEMMGSYPVYNWSEFIKKFPPEHVKFFCAIGYKSFKNRENLFLKIRSLGYECINVVSKTVYIAKNALIGENLFLMPGVVIEPNVKIGNNNIFWSNTTVCHDVVIGNNNFIASNTTIGGFSSIGNSNFIGFSSVVLQNTNIGNNNLLAAQSLIIEDIPGNVLVRGSPAKYVKKICPDVGIIF